ncbi:MAG TPA: hypothetical protein PLG94_18490 [Smithellaceae bacterium]|nr:hypothetical protein [Spirochaetia bacterium]HPL68532.1 hypothetical protein [Smithellaceae bacterium]
MISKDKRLWSSETRSDGYAANFDFSYCYWSWLPQSHTVLTRALPVRSGK